MFPALHKMCRILCASFVMLEEEFNFLKRQCKHLLLENQMDSTLESESNEFVNFRERLGIGPGLDELSRGGVPSAT